MHDPRWEILWKDHDQTLADFRFTNSLSQQQCPNPCEDSPVNWNPNDYNFTPEFFTETIDTDQGFHHNHEYSGPIDYKVVSFKDPEDFIRWMNNLPDFAFGGSTPTNILGGMLATHHASEAATPQWAGQANLGSAMLSWDPITTNGLARFTLDPNTAWGTMNEWSSDPQWTYKYNYVVTAKTLMTDVMQYTTNNFYANWFENPIITRSRVTPCLTP